MWRRNTRAAVLLGGLALVLSGFEPGAAQERAEVGGRLSADLAAGLDDPAPALVWIVFAEQPALEIAPRVRAEYAPLFEAARAPALAALARIDPLLPPRDERPALGVSGLMEREAALLHPDERAALRESRDETVRLLAEMRGRIFEAAAPACEVLQAPVVRVVESLPDGEVRGTSFVLNAIFARVRPSDLPGLLSSFPGIARIERCGELSVDMDKSVGAIGAGSFTSNGYNGSGQSVAIVDTGVDTTHPALTLSGGGNVVTASTVQLATAAGQSNFNDSATSTDDLHGHGTHLAGTVASQDSTYGGVAPGTGLLNAKCFYRTTNGQGSGYDPDIAAATDWALTNNATVLNGSFGGGGTSNGNSAITKYYDAVVLVSGASVALAAGNSGSGAGTILLPGDGYNMVTVGAFNDRNTTSPTDDAIASFSSRGNTSDGRLKPDLSAPGVSIVSCSNTWEGGSNDFRASNGTSMATPHVAGAMALLLDYNASWQPEAVKALLLNSCRNTSPAPTSPNSTWGHGGMDLARAYTDRALVKTGQLTSTGTDVVFYTASSVASGDRQTLAWNRSVAFAAAGRTTMNGTALTLVDLDLVLYDGADGSADASSVSGVNSVEQVKAPGALTTGVVKVKRAGAFPSGQASVDFAVASSRSLTAVNPPALALAVDDVPSIAAGSAELTVTVDLTNTGGLTAFAPRLVMTLPAGWSFAAGGAAQVDVADAAPTGGGGVARTATWTVVSAAESGTDTLAVNAGSDSYGETFTATEIDIEIEIDATDPVAIAGADIAVAATSAAGATVRLDGSSSSDDSGEALTAFEWDTDGDGDFDDVGGAATGQNPDVDFAIGSHTVTLRVVDRVGNADTDTVDVNVIDEAPVADAGSDITIDEGDTAQFDGTGSYDGLGAVTYAWLVGEGRILQGATPSLLYPDDGVFPITLRVTDLAGQTTEDSLTVTVRNVDPTTEAGEDLSTPEGGTVHFDGSATDPGADPLLPSWDLGDGSTASAFSGSHRYVQDGVYVATLTVRDPDGGSHSDSLFVTVTNVPPTFSLPAALGADVGDPLTLGLSATDVSPVDAAALTYRWRVLDGETEVYSGAGPAVSWTPEAPLDGLLEVTVSDNQESTVRSTPLLARTPPLDAVFSGVLDAALDPKTEKRVVVELQKAFEDVSTGRAKRLRKAGKRLAKVAGFLTDAEIADGPLWWRLDALALVVATGEAPPPPAGFVVPATPGDVADLLAAVPSAVSVAKHRKRVGAALLALRHAMRKGASEKAVGRRLKRARKAVERLGGGPVPGWFTRSLDAL